jgi:transcriptional regulator with XRE-family HTH domain
VAAGPDDHCSAPARTSVVAEIRQRRGLSQADLGKAVGASQRVIAYYERQEAQPPGAMLIDLARALRVTTDELLGVKAFTELTRPGPPAS